MSFGDHLEELRLRLLLALAAPLPLIFVLFPFSGWLMDWLLRPLYRVLIFNDLPAQVQVLSPPEFLLMRIKLSIIFALIIASPWMLWQLWRFISPGLYRHERRFVYLLLPGSAILTTSGVLLLYFAMLPLMLQVLVMFGATLREPRMIVPAAEAPVAVEQMPSRIDVLEKPPATPVPGQMWLKMPEQVLHIAVPLGNPQTGEVEVLRLHMGSPSRVVQQFRLREYIGFVLMLMLAITIAFQMPLVILLLGWVGLVTPQWLRRHRKYAFALCAVVAAVITPADAISMILMLIPLYGLYELGILLLALAPARRVAEGTVLRR